METKPKKQRVVQPCTGLSQEIERWLWALEDTRTRTLESLQGLTVEMVEAMPYKGGSNIGTVLYHLAAIELSWLYEDVLQQDFPAELDALFPYPVRDDQDHLHQVKGESLETHLRRLEATRAHLLEVYRRMSFEEFRQPRNLADYDVSPEWVLHHLMQHEAEHRGQIGEIKMLVGNMP